MSTFSIIIPVKPGGYVAACDHLKRIVPDDVHYEILLAEGCAPSQQRNNAAREAEGDILYFLDDDSLIQAGNFQRCSDQLSRADVAVVGGPSLTPSGDSRLQKLFGAALASPFGSGAVRNRYRAHGSVRSTTDKELILCNLAIRRQQFIEQGGFNERLYPNEENEFMERLTAAGFTLIHDPAMSIERSQRRTLAAFIRQMFSYGRGRGQQTLITSHVSPTSFIPLMFVVYLLLTPILAKFVLLLVPLMLYVAACLAFTLLTVIRTQKPSMLLLAGIFPLMHIVNGLGLMRGVMSGTPAPVHDDSIRIRKIKVFGENV